MGTENIVPISFLEYFKFSDYQLDALKTDTTDRFAKSFVGYRDLVAAGGKAVVKTTICSALCDLVELGDVRPVKSIRVINSDLRHKF